MPFGSRKQERELKARVLPRTSSKDGHPEDQALDLDARAMQIMGKRQQLKVSCQGLHSVAVHLSYNEQRNFGFVSTTSFSATVLVSWQAFAWSAYIRRVLQYLRIHRL